MKKIYKTLAILLVCCMISTSAIAGKKSDNATTSEVTTETQSAETQADSTTEPEPKEQAAIELDLSKPNTVKIPKNVNKKAYKSKNYSVDAPSDDRYVYDERDAYQKKTTSYKKSKKFKNGEVGAKYDTTIAPESATQTRTLYTKYNLNSKTSINASYKNNTMGGNQAQNMKGTVSVSPEYKINKKVSVQNDFSKNINNGSTKEGVSIKIKPLKDADRMDIQMGAGQVQYQGGPPPSSQINFGTNFRF